MTYAKTTSVPVKQSKGDIEAVLGRYGAEKYGMTIEPGRAIVMFQFKSRTVRFVLPLPVGTGTKIEQEERSRWRALLLVIKAKLESVESKIESFDEAFLSHIVMQGGETVYEKIKGELPALPPPKVKERA
jgi:hypothetical protein